MKRYAFRPMIPIWIGLCLVGTCFLSFPPCCPGAENAFNKDDILHVLRAQRQSITNHRFRFSTITEQVMETPDPEIEVDPHFRFSEVEEGVYGEKRRRASKFGPSSSEVLRDTVAVWTGALAKEYDKRRNRGTVGNDRSRRSYEVINTPLWLAMLRDTGDLNDDIGAFLSDPRCVLERETEVVENTQCLVASMQYRRGVGRRVWLDPSRAFAVVRAIFYNPEDYTKPMYETVNLAFHDCGNGLWLPTKTVRTKYLCRGCPKELWGTPSVRWTYVASVVQINDQVPPELFDIEFPEGAQVLDTVSGVSYRAGMSNIDDALNATISEFGKLQQETNVKVKGQGEKAPQATRASVNEKSLDEPSKEAVVASSSQVPRVLLTIVILLSSGCVLGAVWVVLRRGKGREVGPRVG